MILNLKTAFKYVVNLGKGCHVSVIVTPLTIALLDRSCTTFLSSLIP